MTRKPILLFAFPALMLLLLAAERTASFLLGSFPASPAMWRIWLELRPFSTMFWQQVGFYLGGSILLEALIIAAAAVGCWTACRMKRSGAGFFLANHVALLFTAKMLSASSNVETASTIADFRVSDGLWLSLMIDFTWKNSLVLGLGLAACAYCHVAFLREARQRADARSYRMLALRDF